MPKCYEGKIALGGLAALAIWAWAVLPLLYQGDTMNPLEAFWHWTTHDPVSFYTAVLASSTIGLWIVTWRGILKAARDTRIIQRAYLSVEPGGLNPLVGREHEHGVVVGHVALQNVGNLPARNVSWFIQVTLSANGDLNDFRIHEDGFHGNNVIPPGTKAIQGSSKVTLASEGFIYVWGQVRYDDGFGQRRFTSYCHRYNRATFRRLDGAHGIRGTDARFHEYGNEAD